MKTKIKILNIVLFLLGLKPKDTRLTRSEGKKFEIVKYEFVNTCDDKKVKDEELIKDSMNRLLQSGNVKLFAKNLDLFEITVEKKRFFKDCTITLNILNVK